MSSDNEKTNKIRAVMIIEVIGKPPEHLTETLNNIIKQIGEEKVVDIKDKKINEPKLMKDQKELYISFAEIEFEITDILNLEILIFKYMPAHIEIISPEKNILSNNDLNDVFNTLAQKLHEYDEVARVLQTERIILEKKLREFMDKEKN